MAQPTKYGTDADDEIWASDGWHVYGLKGNDIIHYGTYIDAGDGNDVIYDGTDDSTILGGNGNDTIYDSYGSDTVNAGSGDDYFAFSGSNTYTTDHNEVDLGSGNDTAYVALAGIGGTTSTLVGGAGLDTLILGGENMGLGPQTLDLRGLSNGAAIKIEGYTISGFERVVVRDTFSIQNVQFGELNDYFFGEGDFNTVYGNGGNDFLQSGAGIGNRLYGGAGNDIIAALGANSNNPHIASGGDGNDMIIASFDRYADYDANSQLSGDSGADGFVKMHLQQSSEADTIVDFKAGEDWLGFGLQSAVHYDLDVTRRIDMPKYNIVNNANNLSFDTLYFGSLGPQGAAHFSYDKKTGILSVEKTEPDDARHGVQFYLKGAPDLALTDFFSMTIQRGGDGNDTVYGNSDSNFLKGDTDVHGIGGNDTIYGEGGDDQIQAGMGNDFIDGGSGADLMFGEKGNDIYIVSEAGDVTFENASEGMDTIRSAISWTLATNVERLELLGSANVSGNGNALANTLIGNAGSNVLSGGTGNDVLDGSGGADRMVGGLGNDTYYVDNAGDVVAEASGAAAGADKVFSSISYSIATQIVENIYLTGSGNLAATGNNFANGVVGNSGNNVLNGGLGSDYLVGGAGNDFFTFNTVLGVSNVDTIKDFNVLQDTIRVDNAIFTALGGAGALAASAFHVGTGAHDADDRIIYNSATGALFYDSNGSVAGGAVQFATLSKGLGMTNADFLIV